MQNARWPPPRVVRPPLPASAATAGGRRVPDLLQRVWDRWWESALMTANGPPHDWIEADASDAEARPFAEISDALSLMEEEPAWDVDDEGLIVAGGTEMDARRFGAIDAAHPDGEPRYYVIPYGTPVSQALGETCVGHVPCQANRFYLSVAEGVPVPHEDRGAIRVRHLPRQTRSLHRWRPVAQERFDALVAARYATHPDESLVAAMRSVVDGLTDRHTRFRNNPSPREVARRSRESGRALQFCPPPMALPSPLLRSLVPPLDPSAPDEAEEYDFSWTRRPRRASTAEYLDDGPSSVVDIHLYEETARFHALLDEATSPWVRAAWAVRNASSLARAPPTYREAARALHAAVQS